MSALALVTGIVVACGVYLLLQRRLLSVILGFGLLATGANLVVFAAGGLRTVPAFIDATGQPAAGHADPVPQALVLTAIVIGFAVMAFALGLALRAYRQLGDDDLPSWRGTEPPLEAHDEHVADLRPEDTAAEPRRAPTAIMSAMPPAVPPAVPPVVQPVVPPTEDR